MSTRETIGVDLGGTKVLVGVVDEHQNVLYERREGSTGRTEDDLMELLEGELRRALDAHPDAAAIGLGIPCTIDQERGMAINAVNLAITDVPIRDLMTERLGVPVFIDNDGNCAALAEHRFGAARGAHTAVLLTIGTGIGGGLIVDGEVFRGSSGAGAELGHIVIDQNGPKCQGTCPNHGCVEALASGTALTREAVAAAQANPNSAIGRSLAESGLLDGRQVSEAAIAGDETALGVIQLIGGRIGVALSSLANIFDPDIFVIGGGAAASGELMISPAREELRRRALPPMNKAKVEAASLGPDAGMIGAATLALEGLDHKASGLL